MALLLPHQSAVHKPTEGLRNPAPGERGQPPASKTPAGVSMNLSHMVQIGELIPLPGMQPSEEDRRCIFQQMKRVIFLLWIYLDPQFCHIKCTSKHLALLPP